MEYNIQRKPEEPSFKRRMNDMLKDADEAAAMGNHAIAQAITMLVIAHSLVRIASRTKEE